MDFSLLFHWADCLFSNSILNIIIHKIFNIWKCYHFLIVLLFLTFLWYWFSYPKTYVFHVAKSSIDFQDNFNVFLIEVLDIFIKFTSMFCFLLSLFAFVTWDSSVIFCLPLFCCLYEDYSLEYWFYYPTLLNVLIIVVFQFIILNFLNVQAHFLLIGMILLLIGMVLILPFKFLCFYSFSLIYFHYLILYYKIKKL